MAWTTPRTWAAGEFVTSAMLNTHVRDNMNSLRSEHFPTQVSRGLVFRALPTALTTLYVERADEIVMDDGTRLGPWSGQVIDIDTAGLNGLDTGSPTNNKWYELYAIAKDDGTKGWILHRAAEHVMDTYYESGDDASAGVNNDAATQKRGQGFQLATAAAIPFVDLFLSKAGSPAAGMYVQIVGDSAGVPNLGDVKATSHQLETAGLLGGNTWVRFVFHTPFSAAATTQYHIVLHVTYSTDAANYVTWRQDTTSSSYANGQSSYYNGTSWTGQATMDLLFRAYGTVASAAVTMPSGYTKKARVGFIRRGTTNFDTTVAHDRFVRVYSGNNSGDFTSTSPTLWLLSAIVPPVPVTIYGGVGHATANNFIIMERDPGSGDVAQYIALTVGQTAYTPSPPFPILGTQHAYYRVGAGTGRAYVLGYRW